MVHYYTTLELFGEKKDLEKIKSITEKWGSFDFDDIFEQNSYGTYSDLKDKICTNCNLKDIFRAWIEIHGVNDYGFNLKQYLQELEGADVNVVIKTDI